MKKLISIMLLIFMLLAVSCNKNVDGIKDNESTNDNSDIEQNSELNSENTDISQDKDSEKTYTALEFNLYDSYLLGANHKQDIKLSETTYSSMSRGTSKKINLLDKSYTAQYDESKKGYYYNQDIDIYEYTTNEYNYNFGINKNTGRIDKCLLSHHYYLDNKTTSSVLTEEECKNVALNILGEHVNANEYNLKNSRKDYLTTANDEKYEIYLFMFVRIINGIETKDNAYFVITEYGDLVQYTFTCLGEMKDAPVPDADALLAIEKSVDKKVDSIYSNVSETYSVEYEIRKKYLVKLEDGKYAMEYVIDADLISKDAEEYGYSEKISLLVYI